jgi:hypothetical protein
MLAADGKIGAEFEVGGTAAKCTTTVDHLDSGTVYADWPIASGHPGRTRSGPQTGSELGSAQCAVLGQVQIASRSGPSQAPCR